jgi:hypothetical protein
MWSAICLGAWARQTAWAMAAATLHKLVGHFIEHTLEPYPGHRAPAPRVEPRRHRQRPPDVRSVTH